MTSLVPFATLAVPAPSFRSRVEEALYQGVGALLASLAVVISISADCLESPISKSWESSRPASRSAAPGFARQTLLDEHLQEGLVVTHLVGLVGSSVRVTLEIEAEIPTGAPDNVVRTVTENSRTLKFTSNSGFETE